MENIKVVDCHCDTLLKVASGEINFLEDSLAHVDLHKMKLSNILLQFMAVYVHSIYKPGNSLKRSLELISCYYKIIENENFIHVAYKEDLEMLLDVFPTKRGIFLALEGGESIESIEILDILAMLGVRSLSLTWNHRNLLADGCLEMANGGLSELGKQVVKNCSRLGILIDVSHLSENGFWDIVDIYDKSIIASHSNCYSLCKHPRNLKDEQIKEIASTGGVVAVNFYPDFLGLSRNIDAIVEHIAYIADLVGVEYIAIGSDFDGADFSIKNLENAGKYGNLINKLFNKGFSEQEIRKIMGYNILKVLQKNLPRR